MEYKEYKLNDIKASYIYKVAPPVLCVKKVRENAILPTRGSKDAAGIDLYACIGEPLHIKPKETVMFGSGIACEFPTGYWGMVVPRSSIGIKRHLNIPQGVAVIDEDYTGEIQLAFYNHGNEEQIIQPGERIAQIVLLPTTIVEIKQAYSLKDTDRGENGIGSTGRF